MIMITILIKIDIWKIFFTLYKIKPTMRTIVIDTETTGLPLKRDSSIYNSEEWPNIIQLSYMIYDDDTHEILLDVNDYISIDNGCNISPESYKVHGLTHTFLQHNGIPIKDALYKFKKHVDSCELVVGHNISFDKRMVLVECIRHKIFLNMKKTYCTMKETVELCQIKTTNRKGELYTKFPSLSELHYTLFQHHVNKLHDASIDIIVCMRCYYKINHNFDIVEKNNHIRDFMDKIKK